MIKQRGFTMIEIIVVLGIVALLSTGATLLFLSVQSNNQREVIVNEIISSLRKAQTRAMNGDSQSEYGVYFETNKYVEFTGSSFVENSPDNVSNLLVAGVHIENINFNGNNYVYYERLTGESNSEGYLDIRVTGISGAKRISINKLGTVSIEYVD